MTIDRGQDGRCMWSISGYHKSSALNHGIWQPSKHLTSTLQKVIYRYLVQFFLILLEFDWCCRLHPQMDFIERCRIYFSVIGKQCSEELTCEINTTSNVLRRTWGYVKARRSHACCEVTALCLSLGRTKYTEYLQCWNLSAINLCQWSSRIRRLAWTPITSVHLSILIVSQKTARIRFWCCPLVDAIWTYMQYGLLSSMVDSFGVCINGEHLCAQFDTYANGARIWYNDQAIYHEGTFFRRELDS